jgi:hypothetical protein
MESAAAIAATIVANASSNVAERAAPKTITGD